MSLPPNLTPAAPAPQTDIYAAEAYLTDGRRLFRVTHRFAFAANSFAAMEDCRTLETRRYTSDELYAMELRPVRFHSMA